MTRHATTFGTNGLWTITPALAQEWLAQMPRNRKLRGRHLAGIIDALKRDCWEVNGETIKFNVHGHLIDGQHRLCAVVETGLPLESYVVFGIPDGALETIDTGLKRSPGDLLGLSGVGNATNLAATLRWLWRYDTGQMTGYPLNPSLDLLKATMEAHPEAKNSLAYGALTARLITRSLGSALHCLCTEKAPLLASRFFEALRDGEALTRGTGIWTLRQRLVNNSQAKAKLPTHEVAALVIKAWNSDRRGQPVGALRWRTTGATPEPFPVIE